MEYYLYLLQIFGGGNPKINEVINAYGSAKDAYRKINGGDMSLIPVKRLPNVKKASLEQSKVIADYCNANNIGI
ncbi:MAG: DNA processing protein DprA, partial [Ruminiclostridium sp.]|nr:DNA processing protein DprA [Ruminiclostridium sp.]